MKKTLITLAALAMAPVAMALDEDFPKVTANLVNPGAENVVDRAGSASFTMIAVIDWDDAHALLGGGRAFIYAVDQTNASAALGFSFLNKGASSSATDYEAYIIRHNNTGQYSLDNTAGYKVDDDLTSTAIASVDYSHMTTCDGYVTGEDVAMSFDKATYENKGKLALSISYDASTGQITLGALTKSGDLNYVVLTMTDEWKADTLTYKGFDLKEEATDIVEHVLWYNTALTTDQIATIAALVVPEPATATLSLLALAGLAARRRRK